MFITIWISLMKYALPLLSLLCLFLTSELYTAHKDFIPPFLSTPQELTSHIEQKRKDIENLLCRSLFQNIDYQKAQNNIYFLGNESTFKEIMEYLNLIGFDGLMLDKNTYCQVIYRFMSLDPNYTHPTSIHDSCSVSVGLTEKIHFYPTSTQTSNCNYYSGHVGEDYDYPGLPVPINFFGLLCLNPAFYNFAKYQSNKPDYKSPLSILIDQENKKRYACLLNLETKKIPAGIIQIIFVFMQERSVKEGILSEDVSKKNNSLVNSSRFLVNKCGRPKEEVASIFGFSTN